MQLTYLQPLVLSVLNKYILAWEIYRFETRFDDSIEIRLVTYWNGKKYTKRMLVSSQMCQSMKFPEPMVTDMIVRTLSEFRSFYITDVRSKVEQ
jgi:hypothetical protein